MNVYAGRSLYKFDATRWVGTGETKYTWRLESCVMLRTQKLLPLQKERLSDSGWDSEWEKQLWGKGGHYGSLNMSGGQTSEEWAESCGAKHTERRL